MLKDQVVRVVGTMSGTSLDGVDAAEIVTDGHAIFEFGNSVFRPYTKSQVAVLYAALGKWPDDDVADACELIESVHAEVLSVFSDVDLIGFHGQTLAHDPKKRGTYQAGDGSILSNILGKNVVWDFRSADVLMGGEGAPLAPFYHFALAKKMNATDPIAILNLGGVGNITWINPSLPLPQSDGALLAFDTGPANAPINDLILARLGKPYDLDGKIAAKGLVNQEIVDQFLQHPFFFRKPPKSLDRDAFEGLSNAVTGLSDADATATLTMACAASVVLGLQACPSPPSRLLVTGGGRRNPTLMGMIVDACSIPVVLIEEAGFDGDMLEAQAFAYLAVRVAKGLPTSVSGTTGVRAATCGGTVSQPADKYR